MGARIQIHEAILVEGRYDVNAVRQVVDTVVLETGGFRIFNDEDRVRLIRRIAEVRGIIILTDSDSAGFVIRNFLKGILPKEQVRQAYIPDILGKEARKRCASKEGKLGVEGMSAEVIRKALLNAGASILGQNDNGNSSQKWISKADLYAYGLSGGQGSAERRRVLLKNLELPEYMSANALLEYINAVIDRPTFEKLIASL